VTWESEGEKTEEIVNERMSTKGNVERCRWEEKGGKQEGGNGDRRTGKTRHAPWPPNGVQYLHLQILMANPPPRHPLNSDDCGLVAPSSNSNRGLFTVRRVLVRGEGGIIG
jgi:hypothetical protein